MNNNSLRHLAHGGMLVLFPILLAACGGGGGGSSPATPAPVVGGASTESPSGNTPASGATGVPTTPGGGVPDGASPGPSGGMGAPPTSPGSPADAATQRWSIVDLTTSISQQMEGLEHTVSGINDAGDIVGTTFVKVRSRTVFVVELNKAFVYSNGVVTDLGDMGDPDTKATAINNQGQIVGYGRTESTGMFHGFLFRNGQMEDLFVRGSMVWPSDINNSGQVVGTGSEGMRHAIIYSNGMTTDIGALLGADRDSAGRAINDKGQALIYVGGNPYANTYLYSGGTIKDLSALPGCKHSEATALNDPGQITGTCEISGSGEVHGFVLTDGNVKDIGTLAGRQTHPAAINNAGQVVGWSTDSSKDNAADPGRDHGFLYSDGTMIDLNTLPEVAAAGWKIQSALGINNAGQIFGRGLLNGHPRYYLLTPVPAS